MSNEDLCELGPYAYILFTGLWMIADRDGRLEYRPRRIKALAMPLWDDVSAKDVENLVEKLGKSGFITTYENGGKSYIQVTNWRAHQNPDPREKASTIPPSPIHGAVSSPESNGCGDTLELHRQDTVIAVSKRADSGFLIADSGSGGVRSLRESAPTVEKSPPPPKKKSKPTPSAAVERKAPGRENRSRESAEPKHAAADVELLRDSLTGLGEQIGMPPPDDALIERVLDAGRGATAEQIHATLVALFKRNKFREMRSWGFVPLVIGDCFRAAACG
jgi:hypothetical protein